MDPREYRDARWHSLLRAAAELGVPDDEAPALVDRVLNRQQRRIRRAEDPDPVVRQALADAVLGPPERSSRQRSRGWLVAAGLVAVLGAVGTVVALTRPEPPPADHLRADQMPSLFGYDGDAASALLEKRGLKVQQRPFRSCEVRDRVVASEPAAGAPYDRGDHVVVYTALPADVSCLTDYGERELAWQLLDFANGHGPAPAFAPRVWVYPGDGPAQILTGREAADPASWKASGVLGALRTASRDVSLVQQHPLTYAVPAVRVIAATEGLGRCGVPDPSVAGTADVVAFLVRSADRRGCPLRVEIYRDESRRIDSVVLYRTSS
ncbi:PASTA domain-containing protein [Nocardioides sp. URHA0020]|uniref:PASTA domain-containing protein n=1 Tax=Nocardioides sp. URHA0020 TaxID=1380392 RepID=UPI000491FB86|nr:PASTA domain-containing protein [Nocardioides sp. URHA0020]